MSNKENSMTEENIKRIWDIDHKAQLGAKITDEEREFFNAHYELMRKQCETCIRKGLDGRCEPCFSCCDCDKWEPGHLPGQNH